MTTPSRQDVTDLLIEWSEGDLDALNKLMPVPTKNSVATVIIEVSSIGH
jgi:hypothetical protein